MVLRRQFLMGILIAALAICNGVVIPAYASAADSAVKAQGNSRIDYAGLGSSAATVLERRYYTSAGTWNMCLPAICDQKNFDWGSDSLTYALYFRWELTHDPAAPPIMTKLIGTAHQYGSADGGWSDVPEWDAVADIREYQVTGNSAALSKAQAAFDLVDSVDAASFAAGSCPSIDYQKPGGGTNQLKTLETDSNYIKAALLLYQVTRTPSYLAKARRKYTAVRRYFLSEEYPLYTAAVYDRGSRCTQLRGQYFASVNGNMIWAGAKLAQMTGSQHYLAQAVATAEAVRRYLCDDDGVYADLQTENDVVEPLIEAMYVLATADHEDFARSWLQGAAAAAAADRTAWGSYGRFFDGPPPQGPVTAWQVNGGMSLMFAAAKLDPSGLPADPWYWRRAAFVPDDASLPASGGTVRVAFSGQAVAVIGTIGEERRKPGHARVLIDGKLMFDGVGIWQGEFSGERMLASSVLFAWRWPAPGRHTITIAPRAGRAAGSTFFHMIGYYLVR